MIGSEYNNFITISDDKILCYNAFSRRFLILTPQKAQQVVEAIEFNHLETLEDETIRILDELGFVIPENFDQLSVLMNEIISVDFDSTFYELTVNPTLDCNFRCWYCYENHKASSELNEDILLRIKKHLEIKLKSPVEIFHLKFFGGEPLLKFKNVCRPLIQFCSSLCDARGINFSVHITSNTYLLDEEMVYFLKDFHVSFQTTLDGSKEFHNKVRYEKPGDDTYDEILANVAKLVNNGIFVTLRINYTLGNLASVAGIIDDLKNSDIKYPGCLEINFQRVWQDFHNGEEDKIPALLAKFRSRLLELGFSSSLPDLINPRTYSCYADKENYACINYNGDFYKCTARDFNFKNRLGVLDSDGTLKWDVGKYSRWRHARFSNSLCHHCRIAPLCLGACRQKAMETEHNLSGCPLCYDEDKKDSLILQRFESQYMLGSSYNQT